MMKKKDNVYDKTTQTEQGSTIEQEAILGSADLGKFKDVNALLQAYRALQAEFTRRSQRLKRYEELENQARTALLAEAAVENGIGDEAVKTVLADGEAAEGIPVDEAAAQAAGAADGSGADAPELAEAGPDSAKEEEIQKTIAEDALEADRPTGRAEQRNTDGENAERECVAEQAQPSLYEQVMADESVRLKIIGDYLASIGKSNAPLVRGGASMLATPPKKSRTIADAGNMALVYLKAHRSQV